MSLRHELVLQAGSGGEENEEVEVAGDANTRLAFLEAAALEIGDGDTDACATCVSSARATPAPAPATLLRVGDPRAVMTDEMEAEFGVWP
jgi:hypothetical protein